MLYTLVCTVNIMAYSCTDPGHFITSNGSTYACSTEHKSAFSMSGQYFLTYFASNIREIYWIRIIATHIFNFVPIGFELAHQSLFQSKSAMVGANY